MTAFGRKSNGKNKCLSVFYTSSYNKLYVCSVLYTPLSKNVWIRRRRRRRCDVDSLNAKQISNALSTYMCNGLLILLFRIVSVHGIINNRTEKARVKHFSLFRFGVLLFPLCPFFGSCRRKDADHMNGILTFALCASLSRFLLFFPYKSNYIFTFCYIELLCSVVICLCCPWEMLVPMCSVTTIK